MATKTRPIQFRHYEKTSDYNIEKTKQVKRSHVRITSESNTEVHLLAE